MHANPKAPREEVTALAIRTGPCGRPKPLTSPPPSESPEKNDFGSVEFLSNKG